jgi:hypothetical protein
VIATGKTQRVERSQLGDISPHVAMHSQSGWVTVETFEDHLRFLKQQLPGDDPIDLMLDCYSVHRNQRIRDAAADLGIVLKFVPAGMTDELQPLDRAVFGIMKSALIRMWRQYCADCETPRLTHQVGGQFLVRAWEMVSAHVIANGWRISEGDDGALDDRDEVKRQWKSYLTLHFNSGLIPHLRRAVRLSLFCVDLGCGILILYSGFGLQIPSVRGIPTCFVLGSYVLIGFRFRFWNLPRDSLERSKDPIFTFGRSDTVKRGNGIMGKFLICRPRQFVAWASQSAVRPLECRWECDSSLAGLWGRGH